MIVAIVLAAGQSKRMGRPKLPMPLGGRSMLRRVLEVLRRTKVERIIVVLGAHQQEVRRSVRFEKELVVFNPAYADGMSSSLKVGLAAAGRKADAAIIALADQPFLSAATVDRLIELYLKLGARIVVPVYGGTRGNPVLFDRSLFPQIAKIRGDVGAKSIVEGNEALVLEVPVKDEGVAFDIDTPTDYERAVSSRKPRRRKTQAKD